MIVCHTFQGSNGKLSGVLKGDPSATPNSAILPHRSPDSGSVSLKKESMVVKQLNMSHCIKINIAIKFIFVLRMLNISINIYLAFLVLKKHIKMT